MTKETETEKLLKDHPYRNDILRILNTTPEQVARMSPNNQDKHRNALTWANELVRQAREAQKAAKQARMPKTPSQVTKWLNLGRMQYAKNKAVEQAAKEAAARNQAAAEAKAARVAEIRSKAQPAKTSFKKTALFLWGWDIKAALQPTLFSIVWLVQTLAQAFMSVGLLAMDHPARTLEGARNFQFRHLLMEARMNLPALPKIWNAYRTKTANVAALYTRQYAVFATSVVLLVTAPLTLFCALINFTLKATRALAGTLTASPLTIGNFTVSGDLGSAVLDAIFGTGSNNQSLVMSGLGSMLAFYSNMLLVFAGIIVLWIIISIVAETARTGIPGGKGFNHLWTPIRLIVALGLLVPLSSGLNSGQWIMLSLAKWGSQEASQVATIFAENMVGTGAGGSVPSAGGQAPSGMGNIPMNVSIDRQFADQIFQSVLCQQVNNETLAQSQPPVTCTGSGDSDPQCVDMNVVGKVTIGQTVTNAGVSGQTAAAQPVNEQALITWANSTNGGQVDCGSATVTVPNSSVSAMGTKLPADEAIKSVLTNQSNVAGSFVAAVTPVANKIAKAALVRGGSIPWDATGYSQYQGAFNQYVQSKGAGITSTLNTYNNTVLNGMVQDIQTYGWAYSPVWIMSVAAQNGQVMDTAQVVPTVVAPPSNPFPGNPTASDAWVTAMDYVNGTNWEHPGTSASAPVSLQKFNGIANIMNKMVGDIGSSNPLGQSSSYGTLMATEGLELISPSGMLDCYDNADPASHPECAWVIKETLGLGQNAKVTSADYDLYKQKLGLDKGVTILPDLQGKQQKFQQLRALGGRANMHSMIVPLGMIMISVGTMLKMLPLILMARFALAFVGWLIMVFEAVLGVNFMALSFLRTQGEGFLPQQVQTNVVMGGGVVLRPVLMAISLPISLIVFNAGMVVVNLLMAPMIQSIVNNGATTDNSYLSLGIDVLFYAMLTYTVANSSFKVIDMLPNFLMGWLGQRMESRAEDAGGIQASTQQFTSTIAYSMHPDAGPMSGYGRMRTNQAIIQGGFVTSTGQADQVAYTSALKNPNSPNHAKAQDVQEQLLQGGFRDPATAMDGAAGMGNTAKNQSPVHPVGKTRTNAPKIDPGSSKPGAG